MKYKKRGGKYYVICSDGDLEVSEEQYQQHLKASKWAGRILNYIISNPKNKPFDELLKTISMESDVDTMCNLLSEALKEHKKEKGLILAKKNANFMINYLISEAKADKSHLTINKQEKKAIQYRLNKLKAIKTQWKI